MTVFQDFAFSWQGRDHTIPADRIMGAIGVVEEHLTLHEIHTMMAERKTVRMQLIASAYGALLRYAGVGVSDEDVYASFFKDGVSQEALVASLIGLQQLMLPPSSYNQDPPPGKQTGERKKAGVRSSKKRSKSPASRNRSAAGA